jgi:hypothetical protein
LVKPISFVKETLMASADYATVAQDLYVAYFGRPADTLGLANFESQLDAAHAPTTAAGLSAAYSSNAAVKQIIDSFGNSAESASLYGTGTAAISVFVTAIYHNLFNRDPDFGGLVFWSTAISSGGLPMASAALNILAGALANTTAQGVLDAQTITNKVAVAANFDTAINTVDELNAYNGDAAAATARAMLSLVDSSTNVIAFNATIDATLTTIVNAVPGQTFTLTTGVDNIVGTAHSDVFIGNNADNSKLTLTSLDTLDGGAGNNTLNITIAGNLDTTTAIGATVTNIQNVNLTAAGFVTADTTAWSGVTALNTHSIDGAFLTAAATTNVTAVDITHNGQWVEVDGGNNVTITESPDLASNTNSSDVYANGTAGTLTITQNTSGREYVGVHGGPAVTGAVNIASTGTGSVYVNGGTNVNVVTAGGYVVVGQNFWGPSVAPTGAVNVASTMVGNTGSDTSFSSINVTGGTTVTVNETATQPVLATNGSNATTYEGHVSVNGSSTTTAVTVNQTASVTHVPTQLAIAGATEADSEAFVALAAGATLIVDGLTFTAGATGTTAAQTAAAFANLVTKSIQGNSTLGTYSGSYGGHFTTGAVTPGATTATASVVFTSAAANTVTAAPAFTGTGTAPTATNVTTGAAATAAVPGVGGIQAQDVAIWDANANTALAGTITSVAVNGYSNSNNGSYVGSNALSSLSLANDDVNSSFWVGINNTAASYSKTLALTVNNLAAGSTVNLDGMTAAITTLNVTTAGKDSVANIAATAVTALTVAGTKAIDLTGSSLGALKTVVVSGAAGVTAGVGGAASLTDINASATSGNVTITGFDATKATYEGGSGVDTLTLSTANPTKAISLGAGDDTLTLAAGTTAPTATIDGGIGSDVLIMAVADAATASGTTTFATKVVGFEILGLTGTEGAPTAIDLAMLGGYNIVSDHTTTTGTNTLTLNNMASGGTLVVHGSGTGANDIVNITNALANTSDVLNLTVKNAGGTTAGSVTAANVETVNIAAFDTTANVKAGANTDTLTLVDAAATSIVVTGNAHLTLTSANTAVTSVNASGMNGGLTYTTAGTVAETVTGGAASNTLTAHAGTVADTLIGGAGNDTLTANGGMDTLTGNAGRDVFVIQTASANLNSYATITDAAAGDTIKMTALGTDVFSAAAISLGSTAVFQDYANAAINAGGDSSTTGHISWFQFGGNTYVVESLHNAVATHDFQNGVDLVVKLVGAVDLSHTSLDTTGATLLIG